MPKYLLKGGTDTVTRDGRKWSSNDLAKIADYCNQNIVPVLFDHNETVENIKGRIIQSEVKVEGNNKRIYYTIETDEPLPQVEALQNSIGFMVEGMNCGACGKDFVETFPTCESCSSLKDIPYLEYRGFESVREVSLVVSGAQVGTGVISL